MGVARCARGGVVVQRGGGVDGGNEDGDVDDCGEERGGDGGREADWTPGWGGVFFKNGRICVGARATVGAARTETDT
jgi:hypothetical protein